MATHIEYTPSSSPTGIQQTISFWIKRSELHTDQCVFEARQNGTNLSSVKFNTNDELQIYSENGGTTNVYLKTTRRFRDTNAWWHIVYAIDTSQGTAADRIKMYVNGVQETAFSSSTYPSQNYDNFWYGIAQKQVIGRDNQGGGSEDFQGILSHFHYSRGYVYQASTFGSTDSTTGEWQITTSPSGVNYGATGWFILKDGNSVTDQSGNGNNFTVGSGTLTKTEDNPSNVFATLNPLSNDKTSGITMLNGNNTLTTPSGGHDFSITTLGMNSGSGKFYCEVKVSSSANFNMIGISDHSYQGSNQELSEDNYSYGYYSDSGGGSTAGVVRGNGSNVLTGMPNYTTNDIIGIAIDLENHKLYFHKNGTYINSGSPTSGSTGTGAVSIQDLRTVTSNYGNAAYFFGVSDWTTSSGGTYQCNFGNGYFGTTAVSSAGTNASNLGIFEYDVPSGYTALCTKGLNE